MHIVELKEAVLESLRATEQEIEIRADKSGSKTIFLAQLRFRLGMGLREFYEAVGQLHHEDVPENIEQFIREHGGERMTAGEVYKGCTGKDAEHREAILCGQWMSARGIVSKRSNGRKLYFLPTNEITRIR